MAAILAWWQTLDAATQTVVAGEIAGAVLWALQRWATLSPAVKWLGADSATARKKLVAVVLAVLAALAQSGGDWKHGLAALWATLTASSTLAALLKPNAAAEPND